jgi:hypothetical protein
MLTLTVLIGIDWLVILENALLRQTVIDTFYDSSVIVIIY